jgi:purine-binding chemotaxis protein CheW
MADRAEDLIGQYLADLLVPAQGAEARSAEDCAGQSVVENAELGAQSASQRSAGSSSVSAAAQSSIKTERSAAAGIAAKAHPNLKAELAARADSVSRTEPLAKATQPLESTLAEPARQQLQQLLNSAWPAVAPVPVTAPILSQQPAPTIAEIISPAQPPKVEMPASNKELTPVAPLVTPAAGKPDWANKAFDTLIVDVAGLKLAIPLVVLGQIFQVTEAFSHLPGQGPLFLGTLNTPRGLVRVINTALLVMPERYEAGFIDEVRFVVSLAGASGQDPWQLALAVNRVTQPVSLACEDVVWRGERSKRPWLLGTVKSQMCALLDVTVIGQFLSAAH